MFFRVLYELQGIQYFLCYLLNMNFKYNFSFEELTMQGTALNNFTEAFFLIFPSLVIINFVHQGDSLIYNCKMLYKYLLLTRYLSCKASMKGS